MDDKILAIDFDGTCVTHHYDALDPTVIGTEIGAIGWIRKLSDEGVKIILYTMRSGDHLASAVRWFEQNQIKLWGINENPDQYKWTLSPKIYAQLYVDDAALGCPLIKDLPRRPFVDWSKVGPKLFKWAGIKLKRKRKYKE